MASRIDWNDLKARFAEGWKRADARVSSWNWTGFFKWTGIVLGVLVVAIVIFLWLFDWNWLRGPIGRYASKETGRTVRIEGDLEVKLLTWTPNVTINRLVIGNPQWAPRENMLTLERGHASVRLLPLLKGDVTLPLVELRRADVRLVRDAQGRANWNFDRPKKKKKPSKPFKLPPIQRFVIDDGKLKVSDARRRLVFTGEVNSTETSTGTNRGNFSLTGQGTLNREPFLLRVTGGPLLNVDRNKPYPFDADVRAGATRITADGAISKPFDLGVFYATLRVSGNDLADMYYLTGLALPNSPPYRVSGQLRREGDEYRVRDFAGRVGDSDIGGQITVRTSNDRPYLTADLRSRRLDWDDMAAIFGGSPDPSETANQEQKAIASTLRAQRRLLPDAPLYVERLRSMDADVTYRADAVNAPGLPIRALSLGVDLDEGLLKLNPVSIGLPQGRVSGTATINGRGKTVVTDLDMRVTGARLEQFIPARGGQAPIEGVIQARAKLRGYGDSVHKAASTADGTVTFVVPRGRMRQAFAELLGVNASKGLLLLLSKDERETPVRCGIADFQARDGVLSARTLMVDTGVVLVKGQGTINLESESLNLRLEGDSKKPRLLRLFLPITLQGKLLAPKPGVDAGAVVAQGGIAAALGSLLNPLAAILPFVELGEADDADCGAVLAEARSRGAPTAVSTARR